MSTVANQSIVAPYLFCNYKHQLSRVEGGTGGGGEWAHYQQRCDVECWEAILASTAAPGFFEEVKLDKYTFLVCPLFVTMQNELMYCVLVISITTLF